MTSERADDKCEKCGAMFTEPTIGADFEDILTCSSCTDSSSYHTAVYYNYESEDDPLR